MTIPLAITVAGLVVWFLATKFKPVDGARFVVDAWWAELGRLSFFCGLLATLLSVSGKPIW